MKKTQEQSTILHDAYFNKPPCLIRLFLIRLILLCGLSASALFAVAELYIVGIDMLIPCVVTAVVTAVLYTLSSFFPAGVVYFLSLCALGGTILNESIRERLTYFADFILIRLDSRLLKTADFLFHERENISPKQIADGCFTGFILIGILISVIYVAAARTRFHSFYTILTFAALVIPVFTAEIAGFHYSIAFFAAFFAGFCAISSAYDLDGIFVFGKARLAAEAAARNERSYRKRLRFAILMRKLRSDVPRYLKYSGNSFIAVLVTFGLVILSSYIIPEGKTFDYEELFTEVQDIGFKIAESIEENFGFSFGGTTTSYDEYFTYEQYGDTGGGIGISKPTDGERPVLDVTLERNDIPIYLRGDIGVNFTGTEWTAIRDEYEKLTDSDGIKFSDKLDGFYPEMQYRITRQKMLNYYNPDDFLPLQKVSVTYRQKTGVVFQPMAAYDLNYKENEHFDSYGDTILRAKNSGGFNTFESLALTPNMSFSELNEFYNSDWSEREWSIPGGMTNDEYKSYMRIYENFVGTAYTGDQPEVIDNLISTLKNYGYISADMTPMEVADGICRYFKENFSYSLTVDNGEGEEILDNFLYKTKEGHCALFATAMTMAMREMGHTARYVTGYVASGNGNYTSDGYLYTLREKDLHAWVEVYCYGIGWLPYDPTAYISGYAEITEPELTTQTVPFTSIDFEDMNPNESEGVTSAEDDDNPVFEDGESSESTTLPPVGTDGSGENNTDHSVEDEVSDENNITPVIIAAVIVLVAVSALVIAVVLFVKKVNAAEKRILNGFKKKPPYRAVEEMYRLVMLILSKEELTPGCEMMTDFAMRVDGSIFLKGTNVFMIDVIDIFTKSEFGNREISPVTEEERALVYKFTITIYRKYMEKFGKLMKFIIKITLFL